MSDTENQLSDVEISIDDARQTISRMESLKVLMGTATWKELIEEGYFRDEASRLVLLKADPSMTGDKEQAEIDKAISAIGPFRQYLRVIMQLGMMAERAVVADEQTRAELLEEEANEEIA